MAELHSWQLTCLNRIDDIYDDCIANRVPILRTVQELPWPKTLKMAKCFLTQAMQMARNMTVQQAHDWVDFTWRSWQKRDLRGVDILINTNVFCWRFDDASLWRCQPNTSKVCELAKSFIRVGFKRDSPLCSRDNKLAGIGSLRCGDGQARVLALRLVWSVLHEKLVTGQIQYCASLNSIFESLYEVPTVFMAATDETTKIVEQAVRHNMKGTESPVSTFDWATIIMNLSFKDRTVTDLLKTKEETVMHMLDIMDSVTSAYNDQLEMEGVIGPAAKCSLTQRWYFNASDRLDTVRSDFNQSARLDTDGVVIGPAANRGLRERRYFNPSDRLETDGVVIGPAAKRQRMDVEPMCFNTSGRRLRIGSQQLLAIKNILSHATVESFNIMSDHLARVGDYKYSALSDVVLTYKHIWPGSSANHDHLLMQCGMMASEQEAAHTHLLTKAHLNYHALLTDEMHAMLVRKVLLTFEDDVFDVGDPNMRARFQPDVKTWDGCRLIVQHWQQSIKTCAQKDLTKEQFDALEAEVLTGSDMNIHFVKALHGYLFSGTCPCYLIW